MNIINIDKTIVILAQYFNPSVFRDHWLLEQGIISNPGDLLENSVFSAQLVQVFSKEFSFLVIPDQLQFTILPNSQVGIAALMKIVSILPHIPYKALGINFHYYFPLFSDKGENLTMKFFYNQNLKMYEEFKEDNPRFGAYMSKNYLDTRLKLDIKPITIKPNEPEAISKELIVYSFNYHSDLKQPHSISEIQSLLDSYDKFKAYSDKIISLMPA
jgi:hypothetical protein